MHEDPIRAGFNSVVSAIDRAARTQLLPSLRVSLDHGVTLLWDKVVEIPG
jgi:hypothetical protein